MLFRSIIGHIKGSLSLVTILASALFGAISGSGVATASAIGGITIPAMKREVFGIFLSQIHRYLPRQSNFAFTSL